MSELLLCRQNMLSRVWACAKRCALTAFGSPVPALPGRAPAPMWFARLWQQQESPEEPEETFLFPSSKSSSSSSSNGASRSSAGDGSLMVPPSRPRRHSESSRAVPPDTPPIRSSERRRSIEARVKNETSKRRWGSGVGSASGNSPSKVSVVVAAAHEPLLPLGAPVPPVSEHAAKAAAAVFKKCDLTRSGTLMRWEFAAAIEMMMRNRLVPYLIDQVRRLPCSALIPS